MCGIAGILSHQPTNSRNDDVKQMLELIRHRGPDGIGYADSPFGTIGHVRLSILDGSTAAAQPFVSENSILSTSSLACLKLISLIFLFQSIYPNHKKFYLKYLKHNL